jgi:hypothetical protein
MQYLIQANELQSFAGNFILLRHRIFGPSCPTSNFRAWLFFQKGTIFVKCHEIKCRYRRNILKSIQLVVPCQFHILQQIHLFRIARQVLPPLALSLIRLLTGSTPSTGRDPKGKWNARLRGTASQRHAAECAKMMLPVKTWRHGHQRLSPWHAGRWDVARSLVTNLGPGASPLGTGHVKL